MQILKNIFLLAITSSCLLAQSGCTTTPSYSGFPTPPESLMQAPRELKPILKNEIYRPVTVREYAMTVNQNYEACLLNAEDFSALQKWVRKQQEK